MLNKLNMFVLQDAIVTLSRKIHVCFLIIYALQLIIIIASVHQTFCVLEH